MTSWPSDQQQLLKKCCSLAFAAHKSQFRFVSDSSVKSHAIFAFPGSWSADDWFATDEVDQSMTVSDLFPSLRVLGSDDRGIVNQAFLSRLVDILKNSQLESKIQKSLSSSGAWENCCFSEADRTKKKRIVFTGHSSGGAIAILATIWWLEKNRYLDPPPLCVTFGSPLVGNKIVGHAVRREGWSQCFMNFVLPRDPVPRLHLSSIDEIKDELGSILPLWNLRKPPPSSSSTTGSGQSFEKFFTTVVDNAFSIASYDSCVVRNCASGGSLLESVNGIVELSPYRPFGSFYFCCGNGKVVNVQNHDAVLQILFYSLKLLGPSVSVSEAATSSIQQHLGYNLVVQDCLRNSVINLNLLNDVHLVSLEGAPSGTSSDVNSVVEELGLSMEARLSLRAAGEMERMRQGNLETVNGYKKHINECLKKLEKYRNKYAEETGYYDAFKQQNNDIDFEANVIRLQLIGYWEEVKDMVKEFELPDWFEVDRNWVELGTRIRLLMEPIDIANFYRHDKKDQTGLYTTTSPARPKYYKYPENWLKHMRRTLPETDEFWKKEWDLDSCFWARVENMCSQMSLQEFENVKKAVLEFEKEVAAWVNEGALSADQLRRSDTFMKWWGKLPPSHRDESCIKNHMMAQSAAPSTS